MNVRVLVSNSVAEGTMAVPPSKSYTHRALVGGSFSEGTFTVRHPLDSDDTRATARALASLGRSVDLSRDSWRLGPDDAPPRATVDCGESGTTLRFLTAVGATRNYPVRFRGRPGLARRPIGAILDVLRAGGARVVDPPSGHSLPFEVQGPLRPLRSDLEISESSQFLSALLLVLPTLPGESRLRLRGTAVSWEYVRATLAVLEAWGWKVEVGRGRVRIPGYARLRARSFEVPGDASSAAYGWAAAAATGGRVRLKGIPSRWPQADLAILDVLNQMGARVLRHPDGATVEGDKLLGRTIDLTDAPDLYPLVGVLGAVARGTTLLTGAPHIVLKESDRRAQTVRLVRGLGARASLTPKGLCIEGTRDPRALRRVDLHDHRMVMSAAVGAMAASGTSTLGDAACVRKSFPGFWEWMDVLGMARSPRR